ncbi:MAG: GNAT family N-acetyltransferase, partial [Bryobacteraceae bacterium]
MAAVADARLPELVELPYLNPADLDPLLAEEIGVWRREFAWDFQPSADLLRRFLQSRSLYGCALRAGGEVLGYAYHVCEGHKGLIGDLYLRNGFATLGNEALLLGGVVQSLISTPGVRRIESQLMMLRAAPPQQIPFGRYLKRHDRLFMLIRRDAVLRLPPHPPALNVTLLPWAERFQEDIAHVLAGSYKGHVDSEINDQYRTIPGARHFLTNIVRFPGCGRFSPVASLVALDQRTRRVCGICLCSLVSADSGHITQLCVLPALRGARLGYDLLHHALLRLSDLGCTSVSLTVTCSNLEAIRLYESAGFRT